MPTHSLTFSSIHVLHTEVNVLRIGSTCAVHLAEITCYSWGTGLGSRPDLR